VIIADDRCRLDAGADQEIDDHRLELRLARLEVVATDEDTVAVGELDDARNERVLWTAVDVRAALEDRRDGKDGRLGYFGIRPADRLKQLVGGMIEARTYVAESLRVCRP